MHWILVGFLIGIGLLLVPAAAYVIAELWPVILFMIGALALWLFAPNLLGALVAIVALGWLALWIVAVINGVINGYKAGPLESPLKKLLRDRNVE